MEVQEERPEPNSVFCSNLPAGHRPGAGVVIKFFTRTFSENFEQKIEFEEKILKIGNFK
jgi:hypothetical protein